jgi:hypothetical protein
MSRIFQRLSILTLMFVALLYCFGNKVAGHQSAPQPAARLIAPLRSTNVVVKKRVKALVPAYFDPEDSPKDWEALIEAGKKISIIAIINPKDGPGDASQQSYRDAIAKAQGAGITVLGYVLTGEGNRPSDEVMKDIEKWVAFYPKINGIFFDEQATGKDKVGTYKAFFAHAREKISGAMVVGNPGTEPSELYLSEAKADIECIFESWGDKFSEFSPPSWAANYDPKRFAVLLHTLKDTKIMKSDLKKIADSRIGNVYLTDDELPRDANGNPLEGDPWNRLPNYWKDEVETIRAIK